MSLFISNRLTDKQRAMLEKLEYIGSGKHAIDKLTVEQAAAIIDELFEEQRMHRYDEMDVSVTDLY